MKQEIKILIINDRPTFTQGIKAFLTDEIISTSIDVKSAYSYEESLCINNSRDHKKCKLDILIIGVDINHENSRRMAFGERYMTRLRSLYPNAKIITVILSTDKYRIYDIIQKIKPDGFFIEHELDSTNISMVITSVIGCKYCYSNTINSIVKKYKKFSNMFDDVDRAILHHLDRGVKTKDLYKHVLRSSSTSEKRIRKMKDSLGLNRGTSVELRDAAKLRGII